MHKSVIGRDGYTFCCLLFELMGGQDGLKQSVDEEFYEIMDLDYGFEKEFVDDALSKCSKLIQIVEDDTGKYLVSDFLEDVLLDRVLSHRKKMRDYRRGTDEEEEESGDDRFKVSKGPDSNWRDSSS